MALKFKIGDRVSVIDASIDGLVQAIDGELVTIESNDGFLMKFEASELVLKTIEQKDFSKFIDIRLESILEKEKSESKIKKTTVKTSKKQAPLEVDLHIHQLTDSIKGLSNFDLLSLQLDTAKKRLEFAIKKNIARVVFIHGVGEGVLKRELEYVLKKYPVEIYPASFQKYGFGATEVYIYHSKT